MNNRGPGSSRDLLISGGLVLHPDGDLDHPRVEDVLVRDGHILAVGEDVKRHGSVDASVTINASGKLVVPGFVNAHYHSHDVLLRGSFEALPLDIWSLYSSPANYPRRTDEEVRVRTTAGAVECLMSGITTVQDMVTVVAADRQHCHEIVNAYGLSGIRAVLGLQVSDLAPADAVHLWRERLPESAVAELGKPIDLTATKIAIERLFSATSPLNCTWALAPSAPQRCSDALLSWIAELSRAHHAHVFTHVYEAKAQALLARTKYTRDKGSLIAYLDRLGLLGPNLTIAHGVWIDNDEMRALGSAGANVAINPTSNLKLRNGVAPIDAYFESGVGVAIGCDNCSGNDAQNMFEAMKLFALFAGMQRPAGAIGAAKKAFVAATLGGARALGLEGEVGSLRAGFKADIVLLRLDDPVFCPLNNVVNQLVYGASPRTVDTTIVGGKVVVEGGKWKNGDISDLAGEIAACGRTLRVDLAEIAHKHKNLAKRCLAIHEECEAAEFELDRFSLLGSR